MIKKILIALLCCASIVDAAIIETHSFADIVMEIDPDTLVLVDLDQTAITSSRTLGSQLWWEHHKKVLNNSGLDQEIVDAYFNPIVRLVIEKVPQRTAEVIIPALIASLQERGITVWSLTGRMKKSPWDSEHGRTTAIQLKELGIDFMKSPLPVGVTREALIADPRFSYGIYFTNWQQKGPPLAQFLIGIDYHPCKIVLIDDSLSQLESVEATLKPLGVPFVGFHYLKLKEEEKNFDPAVGDIELQALLVEGRLLTDEEAIAIKNNHPERPPAFYLEELLLQLKRESGMLTPH